MANKPGQETTATADEPVGQRSPDERVVEHGGQGGHSTPVWDVYDVYNQPPQPNDAAGQKRSERFHEIDHYAENQSKSKLGPMGRLCAGAWLKTHFDQLTGEDKNAITQYDLMNRFADGKWPDGKPLSAADQYMLKRSVSHFPELSVEGRYPSGIDRQDIDVLAHGAKVTTDEHGIITAKFSDGKIIRSDGQGNVWTTETDGTQKIEISQDLTGAKQSTCLTLKADGSGTLTNTNGDYSFPLHRTAVGDWEMSDPEGNKVLFSFDQNTGKVSTSTGFEGRFGADGVSLTGRSDGEDPLDINVDAKAKVTMIVDGKSVTLTKSANKVTLAQQSDGTLALAYPDKTTVDRSAGGDLIISNEHGNFPTVIVKKGGEVDVLNGEGKPVPLSLDMDSGLQQAKVGEADVSVQPDGTIKIVYGKDGDARQTRWFLLRPKTLEGSDGDTLWKPPPLDQ